MTNFRIRKRCSDGPDWGSKETGSQRSRYFPLTYYQGWTLINYINLMNLVVDRVIFVTCTIDKKRNKLLL